MKHLSLCLILMAASWQQGLAQQLQITNYSPHEGVPVYGVNSIFQDSKGWMWFTTGYEVMRYDGHRFRILPLAANTPMNFCYNIREVNNELWVMAAPYLLKLEGDSLRKVENIEEGVEIADHIRHNQQSYFIGKNGLYRMEGQGLRPYITAASLVRNWPGILIPFNDSLLISCKLSEQLIIFNINDRSLHSLPLPVADIRQDEKGHVYVMEEGKGIMRLQKIVFNGNKPDVRFEPIVSFSVKKNSTFAIDGQGNFWTYEQFRELVSLGPGKETSRFNESNGLPSLWFTDMFVDREKNLWIGFNSGLCKIRNTNWERYTVGESLYSNHILFCTSGPAPGQVFIGTQNGVNLIDRKHIKQVSYQGRPFICKGLIASSSTLFYYHDSLLYTSTIDTATLSVHSEKLLAKMPGTGNNLLMDKKGNLIIATTSGIYGYSNKQLTRLSNDTNHFRRIMLDSRGRLWAGKFSLGLHCYRIMENEQQPRLQELFSLDVADPALPRLIAIRALAESKKGEILVGTRNNGLFVLSMRDDQFLSASHYGKNNGLPGNTVWDIGVDTTGAAWIATMNGLTRMEKLKNNLWKLSDEGIKRQIYQATLLFADKENNIWVGSHPGVVVARPDPAVLKKPFSVSVTSIMINGKHLLSEQAGTRQKLKHTDDNISIEFSANTYSQEETVLYSYRLNDKDEWTLPAATHQVNYSALRPGNYKFSVKALTADGQWSDNETNFEFAIMPPFWQRSWFIALVFAAIAAGVYALYRYRVRRIRELFEMRNVIASDLHDEIGSTLTSINILSKVSHNHLEKDQQKASSLLKKVIDQSQQIQENMSDIVWSIRPDNDKMENIIFRMHEYLNHTLEPANIHVDFTVDDKIVKESLTMQQRRDFFLVFKEAVNNIAKYAQCTEVKIRLSVEDGNICLVMSDNGIGFDPAFIGGSNGLRNMRHRAELLKGKISIRSVRGSGTSVELQLPATQ